MKKKKNRLLLLMLPVLIPGVIISGFGFLSISQQKKAKELKMEESYLKNLQQIRMEIETQIQEAVENSFRTAENLTVNNSLQLNHPPSLQQGLKEILLKNPIVKYPFLMDSRGRFVFPFHQKTGISVPQPPFPRIANKQVGTLYQEGEQLELREGKIKEALKRYVKCLKYNYRDAEQLKPYIFNSIGRCYFKLGKYPQAVSYYQSVRDIYTGPSSPPVFISLKTDLSLYFPALRQLALSYQRMRMKDKAGKIYLQLYEEILQYESSENSERFAYFKNEALDFLWQHIQARSDEDTQEFKDESEREWDRFNRARTLDNLQAFTDLDISLRWRYIEDETGSDPGEESEKNRELFRFAKIREFYLSTDTKTQFYKAVKEMHQWENTTVLTGKFQVKRLHPSFSNTPINIAYKKIPGNWPEAANIFFGFMISPGFLTSSGIRQISSKYMDDPNLQILVTGQNQEETAKETETGAVSHRFQLMSVSLQRFFPGKKLVLFSRQSDYFTWQVQKEIRFNYALLTAFILALVLGIYFFYKYQSREAELVRLKSDFTDSASHTLKTPLTRIRMLTEKLQLGWVTQESKKQEYLQTILSETDRMGEMITNMLDFLKIEAGRKQYRMEVTDLPPVVRETLESYTKYIHNQGFQLEVEIDDNIPPFSFDEEAVQLIAVNLLQNAVKYSVEEKFIRVRLHKENGSVVLEVEDRGIGMEEKEHKKIFDRFYRVPGSRVQTAEGSGLGLYLVRHAVHAHHGEITVNSQPGEGSRFKITLPVLLKPRRHEEHEEKKKEKK
ncbi:MAG: GHKL domain-containing protein [Candidatus Aminicenantes bacterium]|nr:GHKL domain-containing protein [Candidatus Aminicenantes bacterium]